MADLKLQYLEGEMSQSVLKSVLAGEALGGTQNINYFFRQKNNTGILLIDASAGGVITLKAGYHKANAVMGDLDITVPYGLTAIKIERDGRFEQADGSLQITSTAAGTVYAFAKQAGLK